MFNKIRKKMIYRRLGKRDLKVSLIGLGTGQFGAKSWAMVFCFASSISTVFLMASFYKKEN